MKNHKLFILILALISMVGPMSIDAYLPSFHAIKETFHVGMDAVQQTLTIYMAAMAVMTLFHGTLSDAVGRRTVILASLFIYTLASCFAAMSRNLPELLICRMIQGTCAGTGTVVGRAMIRDRFDGPEAQKMLSYTVIVFGIAPVIAPIIGGWLEVACGWHSVFVFMASFAFLLLLICIFGLGETLPMEQRSPLHLGITLKSYGIMASDLRFLLQSLSLAFTCTGLFFYISSAPVFIMQILHLPETAFVWLFAPLISGIIIGSFLASCMAHRWKSERIIKVGFYFLIAMAIVNFLYAGFFQSAVPWAMIPILLCHVAMSFVSPAMTVLTLDIYPERRGMAASLQSAITMGIFALISGVLAPLFFQSAFRLAGGVLGGYILCVILWCLAMRLPTKATPASVLAGDGISSPVK
ncbi:MAG: multidrug effflux MFS transporter [Chthoniobacterales bacterium]